MRIGEDSGSSFLSPNPYCEIEYYNKYGIGIMYELRFMGIGNMEISDGRLPLFSSCICKSVIKGGKS